MSELTLDVGCGGRPTGFVNLDLYPEDREQFNEAWNPKDVPHFVLGDAQALPFRDKVFTDLVAYHLIEHLLEPLAGLREFERVANQVELTTPSQFSTDRTPSHLYTWNPFTFGNLLRQVFSHVEVEYKTDKPFLPGSRKLTLLNPVFKALGIHREIRGRCH